MPKKRVEDGLPRTKTTVFLRDDLLERIPWTLTLTNALEPLLERWLAGEGGIKIYNSEIRRVYSGDILAAVESLARQIVDTVAEEREPSKTDGGAGTGGTRQSAEDDLPTTGGRGASPKVEPAAVSKPRKKVG